MVIDDTHSVIVKRLFDDFSVGKIYRKLKTCLLSARTHTYTHARAHTDTHTHADTRKHLFLYLHHCQNGHVALLGAGGNKEPGE